MRGQQRRIVRGDDDRRQDGDHSKRSAKHPEHLRSIQSCKRCAGQIRSRLPDRRTADAETTRRPRLQAPRVTGCAVRTPPLHAQAGSIECRCRSMSFDNSEHTPIGSSGKRPAQIAPFMTSGGTGHENIIANTARSRPLAKVAPTSAARGARKGAGKVGARYPSKSPVIADTGTVSRKAAVVHNATNASSTRPAMATATIHTASATSAGPSRRNITVRFIEVDPSGIFRREAGLQGFLNDAGQ